MHHLVIAHSDRAKNFTRRFFASHAISTYLALGHVIELTAHCKSILDVILSIIFVVLRSSVMEAHSPAAKDNLEMVAK